MSQSPSRSPGVSGVTLPGCRGPYSLEWNRNKASAGEGIKFNDFEVHDYLLELLTKTHTHS